MNFFSSEAISGSDRGRPIKRLSEPTVFLKLEVSAVLAGSPMRRCLGVNETSDLEEVSKEASQLMTARAAAVYLRGLTVRHLVGDDVDTTVTSDTNLGRKVSEIDTNNALFKVSNNVFGTTSTGTTASR